KHWEEDCLTLADGITMYRAGGHFAGGAILHWAGGADGRGALLTGDILQVNADRKSVSFMYSYPNFIPLGAAEVERIGAIVAPLKFERVYGAWWDKNILANGRDLVLRSVERHLRVISSGNGD